MSGPWGGRTIYGLAVILVVAGLTHLSAVLALPGHSKTSAYAMLAKALGQHTLKTLAAGEVTEAFADPTLAQTACLFDLRDGPVSASLAIAGGQFAVLSVHDRHGRVLAGLTSHAARNERLGLTIAASSADQARHSGETTAAGGLGDIRVEAAEPLGFVLAEVLAQAPSEQDRAATSAATLSCRPADP